jgi:hypothetical protein
VPPTADLIGLRRTVEPRGEGVGMNVENMTEPFCQRVFVGQRRWWV